MLRICTSERGFMSLTLNSQCPSACTGSDIVRKVHYLNTGCGEDVLHQVLVDPSVSLQPLAADPDDLWPLQQAHLQLKCHCHLPKVPPGLTF